MTIREFALELLQSAGCSLDCYKGDSAKYALQDVLSVSKERELPFPVEDIANELIKIGNEQPDPPAKGHKPFKVIYETDDFVDGIEEDNFEDAKANALSILMDWIVEEQVQWELDSDSVPRPTEKQIEAWDTMIESCSVRVVKWDEDLEDYCDFGDSWHPSEEEEYETNWLSWEVLKKKYGW